jgi:hypothetical protein
MSMCLIKYNPMKLRHYATSRKAAGSIPYEVQPHYGYGFDSASNRNDYQESSWG